jgi:hypothetical protein
MSKISAYIISISLIFSCLSTSVKAQDTIPVQLKVRIGAEVSGPVTYAIDKKVFSTEAYVNVDLNEIRSVFFSAGYTDYSYGQYNYSFKGKGSFLRAGLDFNLLKPDKAQSKYWIGIGLHYGLSRYSAGAPFLERTNYWGTTASEVPTGKYWGHFLEFVPGVRTEIFNHVSIGWSVSIRMLVKSGTGSDIRPLSIPGFGDGSKTITSGMNYFLVWSIPYKKINAVIKKPAPDTEEDDTNSNNTNNSSNNNNTIRGSQQQSNIMRP